MNFSTTNYNYKTPGNANDLNPKIVNQTMHPINATSTKNNRALDPMVLEKIRELSSANASNVIGAPSPLLTQPKNPFQVKTGLLFRDILGRADNTRSCSSCGTKK